MATSATSDQVLVQVKDAPTLLSDYATLFKVRVSTMVVITAGAGFYLGSLRSGISPFHAGLLQALLGITVVAVVLLLLPFLLVMAGVGAAMLLWFVASAAVLGALVFWLVFPGTYGLAVLLLILVIGLLLVDRRSRHGAS